MNFHDISPVLFIFVNLVFFGPKMILCIKIEISRNVFYNKVITQSSNWLDFRTTELKIQNLWH